MVKPSLIFLLTLAAATLLAQKANASEDISIDEIMRRHVETMGGLYNWNQVQSIRLAGTIERDGKTADIVIIKKRPNQIRATITLPIPGREDEEFQIIRTHDGKTAWTATRLAGAAEIKKEELPEDAANELLADAGVLPLLIKIWREGAKLELLSPQRINGVTHFRIRATDKALHCDYTFYVSSDSFLVTQYDSIDPQHRITQTTLDHYSVAQNVLIPKLSIIQAAQSGKSVMTTNSIEVGVGIYEEYFASKIAK
ncbi:MAG: hypothetical protein NWT02_03335 [Opitutales bacterium]|jgi:hypothetical protein|nr:hypothetical protein [Opitutales bacterium]MDP4644664.1 hypothetical protein [Opitutales bacterium]MDP4777513.1 hypothetical protein [Opitutales bacterium]MDP4884226.1 hypothetical protein [Opitutales bacterium]MDP5080185.1 hypothetical protein [Opitutales bacterium]